MNTVQTYQAIIALADEPATGSEDDIRLHRALCGVVRAAGKHNKATLDMAREFLNYASDTAKAAGTNWSALTEIQEIMLEVMSLGIDRLKGCAKSYKLA